MATTIPYRTHTYNSGPNGVILASVLLLFAKNRHISHSINPNFALCHFVIHFVLSNYSRMWPIVWWAIYSDLAYYSYVSI